MGEKRGEKMRERQEREPDFSMILRGRRAFCSRDWRWTERKRNWEGRKIEAAPGFPPFFPSMDPNNGWNVDWFSGEREEEIYCAAELLLLSHLDSNSCRYYSDVQGASRA